jgi:hypothetical protein
MMIFPAEEWGVGSDGEGQILFAMIRRGGNFFSLHPVYIKKNKRENKGDVNAPGEEK